MNPVRILVADDHHLVRAGLCALLKNLDWVEVVAEASNGREALDLVKSRQPDIVLLDIAMSELNGLEAAGRMAKEFPKVRVIILSMHANEEYVLCALREGAAGYLLKDAATLELELAIKAVSQGNTYLSPGISRQVVENYIRRADDKKEPLEQLTSRQREILQLIAEGKNTKEIGYMLNISVKTVESHRAQLMERLKIHDIPGLVRFVMRTRLIPPNP